MCLLNKREWNNTKLLLWRFKIVARRKQGNIWQLMFNFVFYVGMMVFMRNNNPITSYDDSANIERMVNLTSTGYYLENDLNKEVFANTCTQEHAFRIGFVQYPGVPSDISTQIYAQLEMKMLTNDTEKYYAYKFANEDELDEY